MENIEFDVVFDNAGGVTLQCGAHFDDQGNPTQAYTHFFDPERIEEAAERVSEILDGENPFIWEGDTPEHRLAHQPESKVGDLHKWFSGEYVNDLLDHYSDEERNADIDALTEESECRFFHQLFVLRDMHSQAAHLVVKPS